MVIDVPDTTFTRRRQPHAEIRPDRTLPLRPHVHPRPPRDRERKSLRHHISRTGVSVEQPHGGGAPAVPLRKLGFWSIWALGVGAVVGDGIFLALGEGIEKAGPSAAFAFLLAGLFQMFLMLALGELAVGMPSSGAMSDWAARLLGDWWGFLAGFAFALGWAVAGGSVGIAIGQFTCWFFFPEPHDPAWVAAFAILFLTLFAALNALGVEIAAKTQLVLVFLLVGLMVVFSIVGAAWVDTRNYQPMLPNGWNGFWIAVPLGTYAYLGAITLATAGGERARGAAAPFGRASPFFV